MTTFLKLIDEIYAHPKNWANGYAEHTKAELKAMSLKQLQEILTRFKGA